MRKPSEPSRQPSVSPLSGYTSLRDATTRGPSAACPPAATRAAAPSPKRPLTTRSAVVTPVIGQLSEQSSTASSAA
jgi:hypothetical protein